MGERMTPAELDAADARIRNCASYNFGMRVADVLAHEDAPRLVAEVRARDTVIEAVRAIHREKHGESPRYAPEDVMHDGPIVGWEPYTMCAGCSVSPYPCRTIRAIGGSDA